MNDFAWHYNIWIKPGEGSILAVVVVAHLVLLLLIEQKKISEISQCFAAAAPWAMIYGYGWIGPVFIGPSHLPSVTILFCIDLTLAMGLIYAVRGFGLSWRFFRGLSIFSSFILFEIITLPPMLLGVKLFAPRQILHFLHPAVYLLTMALIPLIVWSQILMKIERSQILEQRRSIERPLPKSTLSP